MSGGTRWIRVLLQLLAITAPLRVAAPQRLAGIVLLPDSTSPASGVLITVSQAGRKTVTKTLTDTQGKFELSVPSGGHYDLRALRIGFRPTEVGSVEIAGSGVSHIRVVLGAARIVLAPARIRGENVCQVNADTGQLVVRLWEQAKAALDATRFESGRESITATVRLFERTLDSLGRRVLAESSTIVRGTSTRPFASVAPDSLARVGFVVEDGTGVTYYAPDADVLLSETFAAGHCFRVEPPPVGHPEWLGIGVRPALERDHVSDIAGVLWIDRASAELRSLEYRYTSIPPEIAKAGAGGYVDFLRLPTGRWIVSRWEIRMPRPVLVRVVQGYGNLARVDTRMVVRSVRVKGGETLVIEHAGEIMYRSSPSAPTVIATAAGTAVAGTQSPPDSARGPKPKLAIITGLVTDATTDAPIAGAQVQLAGTELAKLTNSDGRFRFLGLAAGDYDLNVRRIGYLLTNSHVSLNAGKPLELKIALRRLPPILAEVRVNGRMLKVPPRYEEVYRRAALGWGRLITREDIEQANPYEVKSLLQNIPGVHVNDRGITFERCQAGGLSPARSTQPAKVQIYIDGIQVTNYNRSHTDIDLDETEEAFKLVHPSSIQAIEIYAGVAQIPGVFLSDACAVIAIWTKAY